MHGTDLKEIAPQGVQHNGNMTCSTGHEYRVSIQGVQWVKLQRANMTRIQGELNKNSTRQGNIVQHEKDTGFPRGKVYWVSNRTRIQGVKKEKNAEGPTGQDYKNTNMTRI